MSNIISLHNFLLEGVQHVNQNNSDLEMYQLDDNQCKQNC